MTPLQRTACANAWIEQARSLRPNGEPFPMDKPRSPALNYFKGFQSGMSKKTKATRRQLEEFFTLLYNTYGPKTTVKCCKIVR